MAKTVKCAFCGKEMVTGFFKGEDWKVNLGGVLISCCDDCYRHFELDNKIENDRFNIKMENYKKTNKIRKISESDALKLYHTYFKQMKAYRKRSEQAGELKFLGFFHANENGYVSTTEFRLGSVSSGRDMEKAMKQCGNPAVAAFDGRDISRIEYRVVNKLGVDAEKPNTSAFAFEVRLNDPREMTYRPSVVYFVFTGTAFLAHAQLRQAEEYLLATLCLLQRASGTTAQIVKMK